MNPMIPKDQKIYNLHYDDVRGDVFTAARRHSTSGSEDKIKSKEDHLEAKKSSKKKKKKNENSRLDFIE